MYNLTSKAIVKDYGDMCAKYHCKGVIIEISDSSKNLQYSWAITKCGSSSDMEGCIDNCGMTPDKFRKLKEDIENNRYCRSSDDHITIKFDVGGLIEERTFALSFENGKVVFDSADNYGSTCLELSLDDMDVFNGILNLVDNFIDLCED